MSLYDADEILKDDINIIEGLMNQQKKSHSKDLNVVIQLAQKSNDLADLYYEAMDGFNERYYHYKLLACLNYETVSKSTDNHNVRMNSRLLSILLYLQAGKPETARKKVMLLKKKQKFNKSSELDENLFLVLDLLVDNNLKHAKNALRVNKSIIDEELYDFFQKTLQILKKMAE